MARITGNTALTALAVATAIFIAPTAWSGGKLAASQKTFTSQGVPVSSKLALKQPSSDRFIVTYRDGAKQLGATARAQGFSKAGTSLGLRIAPMRTLATGASLVRTDRKLDKAQTKRLINELMKDTNVRAVEVDRLYKPMLVPNDPGYAQQWHYKNGPNGINAEPAWDLSTGAGVVTIYCVSLLHSL